MLNGSVVTYSQRYITNYICLYLFQPIFYSQDYSYLIIGGWGRIRTYVPIKEQIYSLSRLTTSLPNHIIYFGVMWEIWTPDPLSHNQVFYQLN